MKKRGGSILVKGEGQKQNIGLPLILKMLEFLSVSEIPNCWHSEGFPFGGAEKRKEPRSFPRGLSEPRAKAKTASSAAAEATEHRREVPAQRAGTGTVGVAFFWLLFLAKQEK